MVDAWASVLDESQSDENVRAVVLTGAGSAFCSGVDLDAFKNEQRRSAARMGTKDC
jgi:enoyl-CoA hydratase/carnithine racemase